MNTNSRKYELAKLISNIEISKTPKELFLEMWHNIRTDSDERLTRKGFYYLKNKLDLEFNQIKIANYEQPLDCKTLLYISKMLKCPFYLTQTTIYVFSSESFTMVVMYDGDIVRMAHDYFKAN